MSQIQSMKIIQLVTSDLSGFYEQLKNLHLAKIHLKEEEVKQKHH